MEVPPSSGEGGGVTAQGEGHRIIPIYWIPARCCRDKTTTTPHHHRDKYLWGGCFTIEDAWVNWKYSSGRSESIAHEAIIPCLDCERIKSGLSSISCSGVLALGRAEPYPEKGEEELVSLRANVAARSSLQLLKWRIVTLELKPSPDPSPRTTDPICGFGSKSRPELTRSDSQSLPTLFGAACKLKLIWDHILQFAFGCTDTARQI